MTEKTESGFQGSVTFTFPCNRWFAKNEDDGAIVRELVPSTVLEEGLGRDGKVSVQEHAIDTLDGELIWYWYCVERKLLRNYSTPRRSILRFPWHQKTQLRYF